MSQKIVDTQVKYGRQYKYVIYAYDAVIETVYKYLGINFQDVDYNLPEQWQFLQANVQTSATPRLLLVEQQIYEEDHTILDSPPTSPDVQIFPYHSDKKNLLINLNSTVGEYLLQPVFLGGDDPDEFDKFRHAQKIGDNDPVLYKNDDSVGAGGYFEIYRLMEHPTSWQDFDTPIAITAINESFGASMKASSVSYRDEIVPNVKFYYMFRVRDAHGHMSNPSEIYEVEIVEDRGIIYFLKKIVDFAPVEPSHPSRPMRRLIEIKPAFNQSFASINEEKLSALDIDDFDIGDANSPWGKRYKFRFVSKKSGKKIDLNVKFKTKMEPDILPED